MATLGKTATPTSATHGWILGNSKQVCMAFTVPSPGAIFSSVSFWAATTTSGYIWGVIWDAAGNVLGHGSGVNTSGGAQHGTGPGGDGQWHTDNFATPAFAAAGASIFIGWQNNDTTSTYWAYNGGDHSPNAGWDSLSPPGSPVGLVGLSNESPLGAVAAYATYTPAGGYVRRSGIWTAGATEEERSGTFGAGPSFVRRSGIWQPGS